MNPHLPAASQAALARAPLPDEPTEEEWRRFAERLTDREIGDLAQVMVDDGCTWFEAAERLGWTG